MATSQNGWSANDRSVIASFTIPGTTRRVALRKGDCSVVLLDFLAWFDKNIESIDGGELDDWGYAERPIRGSTTTLSNHASGTAVDVNAPRHALGVRHTFTAAQTKKIRAKLVEYSGVIRWGGDYVSRADEMHFEINAGAAAVKVQADRIRSHQARVATNVEPGRNPRLKVQRPLLYGPKVADVHRALIRIYPGNKAKLGGDVAAKRYGAATDAVVAVYKKNRGIVEEGWGEQCWTRIRKDLAKLG